MRQQILPRVRSVEGIHRGNVERFGMNESKPGEGDVVILEFDQDRNWCVQGVGIAPTLDLGQAGVEGETGAGVVDVLHMKDLDTGLVHDGVVGTDAGRGSQERLGVLAAGRIEKHVKLDLANLLALELHGQRSVAVFKSLIGIADERIPKVHLGLRRQQVVAVVASDHLDLVEVYFVIECAPARG